MQEVAFMHMGHQHRHPQRLKVFKACRLDQVQREMRAHARTEHLGRPQGGAAFECNHLLKSKRRSASQDGAHIAGVLHAVEHHRRSIWLQGGDGRQFDNEAHARRRLQTADVGKQGIGKHYHFTSFLGPFHRR